MYVEIEIDIYTHGLICVITVKNEESDSIKRGIYPFFPKSTIRFGIDGDRSFGYLLWGSATRCGVHIPSHKKHFLLAKFILNKIPAKLRRIER